MTTVDGTVDVNADANASTNPGDRSASRRWPELALVAGFLAFTAAVVAARGDPPAGYELSIYGSTTPVFWAGVAAAVVASLVVSFNTRTSVALRTTALALAAGAVVAILMLPLLRGYFFYGGSDSLSHLGWARMMAGEVPGAPMSPLELLYPGIHSTAVAVSGVVGIPLRRAFLHVVLVFTVAFVVFVPLCVRAVATDDLAVTVGTVCALLFLPINNVSVFNMPYPTSQGLYLLPLLVYLVIVFVLPDRGSAGLRWGGLLALVSLSVVFLHPIVAAPALLILGAISAVQYAYRRYRPAHRISAHRALYANAAFMAVAFIVWAHRFERVVAQESFLVQGLFFGGAPVGDEISRRAGSLSALGTGIAELYVKIFLVSTVFAVIVGLVVLASLLGRIDGDPDRAAIVKYLSAGVLPVVAAFLAFFLASLSVLPFRFLGAVMVIGTILGAVAIVDGLPFRPALPSRSTIRRTLVVLFLVALALQMAHVHQSPYIYRGSAQVTEARYVGHQLAFEHRDPAVAWAGPREGPYRYIDAIYGTSRAETTPGGLVFDGHREMVPFDVFGNNMTDYYGDDRYVGVSRSLLQQEVGLYDGFRYSREEFLAVETTPGVHRIQSNDEYWLYYVDAAA